MIPTELARLAVFDHGACQKEPELVGLIELLQEHKLNQVLEIGSQDCGTLWLWSQLATDDATLVAVDLEFRIQAAHCRANQSTTLIRGNSHESDTIMNVCQALDHTAIDLLFIDGDHTLRGVSQDWAQYRTLVRPGGFIVFHDIVEHPPEQSEVHILWAGLKECNATREFIFPEWIDIRGTKLPPNSCGIGVIQVEPDTSL